MQCQKYKTTYLSLRGHACNKLTLSTQTRTDISETPPPPNPKGQCPNSFDDLAHDSDYCYRIKADSAEKDGKSWGDANTECIAQGASLASIHGDHGQDAIYNFIKNKALDVWIGLQANINFLFLFNLGCIVFNLISVLT